MADEKMESWYTIDQWSRYTIWRQKHHGWHGKPTLFHDLWNNLPFGTSEMGLLRKQTCAVFVVHTAIVYHENDLRMCTNGSGSAHFWKNQLRKCGYYELCIIVLTYHDQFRYHWLLRDLSFKQQIYVAIVALAILWVGRTHYLTPASPYLNE